MLKTIIEFFKRGFYYMWKMDLIIFLVIIIGILLLLLFSFIYGRIHKNDNKDDENSKV